MESRVFIAPLVYYDLQYVFRLLQYTKRLNEIIEKVSFVFHFSLRPEWLQYFLRPTTPHHNVFRKLIF